MIIMTNTRRTNTRRRIVAGIKTIAMTMTEATAVTVIKVTAQSLFGQEPPQH